MELLTNNGGVIFYVDEADVQIIKDHPFSWRINCRGYVSGQIRDGNRIREIVLHRWLLGVPIGSKLEVDHIDGNPLNNRKENLRVATHRQNGQNQKKIN